MKMNISSVETHCRTHTYKFEQRELEQLALEKVAKELGLNLNQGCLKAESRIVPNSQGINPTLYECQIRILENLDCKE